MDQRLTRLIKFLRSLAWIQNTIYSMQFKGVFSSVSLRTRPPHHPDSSSDDHVVGLSDPLLSQGRRRMLVNRLHSTGVKIDIDLPQIASSLIESISGITLPLAAGTCTRCPTKCRLSRSDAPWSCTVELRFITDKKGQPLGQARNEPFGDTITGKSLVEDRIRRAQPSRRFLDDSTEVSFSTNYISIQIGGPEVADLSFMDFPGLIASVGRGGNERDIAMVENLITAYISKPSCVILLTVACETDFENQGAHRLTKKYDPEIVRIPRGDEENWLPLIRNEQESLENNWYCVKQPTSGYQTRHQLGRGASARERLLFLDSALVRPRSSISKKYLRTSDLIDRLRSILSDLISKRDPVGEIASLLHGFVGELRKILEGVPRVDGLSQTIRPAQEQFRRAIHATAPDFQPFLVNEDGYLSDGDDSKPPQCPDLHRPSPRTCACVSVCICPVRYSDLRFRFDSARTRELPGHYPFVVQESFIVEFTSKWATPAMVLCRFVHNTLGQHVKALITLHFSSFGQVGLEQRVMKILVQDYMKQRANAAQVLISKLICLERDGPLTLNEHQLADYKTKFLSEYKGAREKAQNPALANALETYRLKLLPPDRMDPALSIMSDVRAYFQVAYKRMADNVLAAIDSELVRGVGRELLPTLYRGLGINGPEGLRICRELAQESPSVAGKREELLKRLERLETASRDLATSFGDPLPQFGFQLNDSRARGNLEDRRHRDSIRIASEPYRSPSHHGPILASL
ncbi:P-loop containing nucleoside triphosphate hydrolase protein [Mycena leptocephala]|nr:P-loop containing nucleoside triphosphate hydrolase protein [Mycena leptocephala]